MQCEVLVAEYLEKQGWSLIKHRHRVGGVELDLILRKKTTIIERFKKKSSLLVVEVKSYSNPVWLEYRVSPAQLNRLRFALHLLIEGDFPNLKAHDIELWFAFVPRQGGKILFIPDQVV
ncbi:MAG: YraN family protein [Bdellovibrionales bacterium]|nr:YraN family protein [Bdellovibrionales bacterium]